MALNSNPHCSCIMDRGSGLSSEQLCTHTLLNHIFNTITHCLKAEFHLEQYQTRPKGDGKISKTEQVFPLTYPFRAGILLVWFSLETETLGLNRELQILFPSSTAPCTPNRYLVQISQVCKLSWFSKRYYSNCHITWELELLFNLLLDIFPQWIYFIGISCSSIRYW